MGTELKFFDVKCKDKKICQIKFVSKEGKMFELKSLHKDIENALIMHSKAIELSFPTFPSVEATLKNMFNKSTLLEP